MSENVRNSVVAVVQDVCDGKNGNYAVASSEEITGSITFSLDGKVWKEENDPEKGDMVVLGTVVMRKAGWRAKQLKLTKMAT